MTKPKKIKYPIHKMGKNYGYEEFEDGSIEIAPALAQIMDSLQARESAVNRLLKVITKECTEALTQIAEEQRKFWASVEQECNLDVENKIYFYNQRGNKITSRPKTDDEMQGR